LNLYASPIKYAAIISAKEKIVVTKIEYLFMFLSFTINLEQILYDYFIVFSELIVDDKNN